MIDNKPSENNSGSIFDGFEAEDPVMSKPPLNEVWNKIEADDTDIERSLEEENKEQNYTYFINEFNSSFRIDGKSIEEWQEYFYLEVPPDPTSHSITDLESRLLGLYQEASFKKATCLARLKEVKRLCDNRYREECSRLIKEYEKKNKRLPSRATLDNLVRHQIQSISDLQSRIETELQFWKDVLIGLYNNRKVIESLVMNLGIEAKLLRTNRTL